MTKLIITRGLPGSGKTTWARQQPAWRVNRDDLRAMLVPEWPHGAPDYEDMLTRVQRAAVRALLANRLDVVVDDTNLCQERVNTLMAIAVDCHAFVEVVDFTDVPLEVCLERDAARPNPVGEQVIRGMWAKYLAPAEAGKS